MARAYTTWERLYLQKLLKNIVSLPILGDGVTIISWIMPVKKRTEWWRQIHYHVYTQKTKGSWESESESHLKPNLKILFSRYATISTSRASCMINYAAIISPQNNTKIQRIPGIHNNAYCTNSFIHEIWMGRLLLNIQSSSFTTLIM